MQIFFDELKRLGYEDGKNVTLLNRTTKSDYTLLPALTRELVDARVDVLVSVNTPATRAAVDATKTIPIVMCNVGDPVGSGFVSNMARPGGNVTGISNMVGDLAPKRLAVLHELVPGAKRVAVLYNPVDPINEKLLRETRTAAEKLGLEARAFTVKTPAELGAVFQQVLDWRAQAAIWLQGQAAAYEPAAMALAEKHKLPMMMGSAAVDGLVTYTNNSLDVFRKTASHVDKILKGAKPGDLPVEQPTQFELVINLKMAKAIGLKVPQSIMIQATRVIE
jgi:putative ABC transport system substrate-binding protein